LRELATHCVECGADTDGSKFCPYCSVPFDADDVATKPLRRVAAGRPPAMVAPATRRLTFWAGAAWLLAVIGLAVGGFGFSEAINAKHATHSLQAQVVALQQRVSGDESHVNHVAGQLTKVPGRATMAAAQAKIAAVQHQLSDQGTLLNILQRQGAAYINCLPALQSELAGLAIDWRINTVHWGASSFSIADRNQISQGCARLLYG
jgi:hypothetical protein